MGKLVDIKTYAADKAITRAQTQWQTRFPETLRADTRLKDLSDPTLLTLAHLGDEVMRVLHDLVMGVLGLGPGMKFDYLSGDPKLKILDITLFVIDQIRWECMSRLDWIHGFPAEVYPVVDLIMNCERIKAEFEPAFPQICPSHPDYEEFMRRRDADGETMVRFMIPSALTAFAQKI